MESTHSPRGGGEVCTLLPSPRAILEAEQGQRGEFGAAVAITGGQAPHGWYLCAVGAPRAMDQGQPRGSVRLFSVRAPGHGMGTHCALPQMTLKSTTLVAHARFGAALDLSSGGLLAVGAPGGAADGGVRDGIVELFQVGSPGEPGPLPIASLGRFAQASGQAGGGGSAFGAAVALSDDGGRLAVGAPMARSQGGVAFAGRVVVYDSRDGEWTLAFSVEAPVPSVAATFGHALDWVGETLVVGAPGDGTLAPGAGRVYGIATEGDQMATTLWELAAPDGLGSAAGLRYGEALTAIDPGTLAIGGRGRGLVEIVSVTAGRAPAHRALLRGDAGAGFGLGLTAVPGKLYVGVPFAVAPDGSSSAGRVEVFSSLGAQWVRTGSLVAAYPGEAGEFGLALAAAPIGAGRRALIVGEPGSSAACGSTLRCAAGAAFVR